MEKQVRTVFLVLICGFCLLVSGCTAKFAQNVTVGEDGSFDTIFTIVGPEGIKSEIKKTFAEMQANATRPVHDAETDWDGYEAGFHDGNLAAFLQRMPSFQKIDKKQYDVKLESGWLYDAYAFHVSFPEDKESAPPTHEYNPDDPNRFRYDFTLNLPYASEKNNADTVSEDGKVLYWNLAATVSEKGANGVNIFAEFRLWHWERIVITALVLAALSFLCLRAWRKSQLGGAGSASQKNVALICGALLIAGMGWCVHSILQFPVLTEENVIGGNLQNKNTNFSPRFDTHVDVSNIKMEMKILPEVKLIYPVITLKNEQAANAINQDIKSIVDDYEKTAVRSKEKNAILSYDVRSNTDDYISIVICKGFPFGESNARNFYYTFRGYVYDKKTGKRKSLNDYIHITKGQIIKEAETEFYVYSNLGEGPKPFNIENAEWRFSSNEAPPDDFYLDQYGNLFILCQAPYMSKHDLGTTCVRLTPQKVMQYRTGK